MLIFERIIRYAQKKNSYSYLLIQEKMKYFFGVLKEQILLFFNLYLAKLFIWPFNLIVGFNLVP